MLNMRFGTSARRCLTRVDLPDPEGAEMMKTVLIEKPRRGDRD
jgi:hypothetical protein